jgi:flavodoxin
MKKIIFFYSRTGTTKKVAKAIAEKIDAEVEEIRDTVDRSGAIGYVKSGRDAMKKRLTKLEPLEKNPAAYDLVIVGTPIWGWNMSVPVRTFVTENKDGITKAAFFCTMGGSGDQKAFAEMAEIISQKPLATMALTTKKVVSGDISEEIKKFANSITL